MKQKFRLLTPPGEIISMGDLQVIKAKQFAHYLGGSGALVRFLEVRKINEPHSEVVVFQLKIERPQRLAHKINRLEPLAAIFSKTDDRSPEVISLRPDFPCVPHLNLTSEEFPRSICLYEQTFEQTRLTWTPAEFLRRIHHWFKATAKGTLHADDQPLEPLIGATNFRLILPANFDPDKSTASARPFTFYRINAGDDAITFRMVWQNQERSDKTNSVIAAFICKPQTHGIIHRQPANLFELHTLCQAAELDLAARLKETIRSWILNKTNADILDAKLVLLIYLPKMRQATGKIETTEVRAFLTLGKVRDIGEALGLLERIGNMSGMLIGQKQQSWDALKAIQIGIMQVHDALTPKLAALMNGYAPCENRIVGIGTGALGSQVFNNLLRSGYGKWTLIDDDVLLPHNCARHFLGDWAVGKNKAEAMAEIGNAIFGDPTIVSFIPGNILTPQAYKSRINETLAGASVVLDMSASIAVARHLAELDNAAKNISIFITPNGKCLVVMAEDKERTIRLDWLEMLHYRAVLNAPPLANSFQSKDARIRYGNSCRDVTTELSQDCIAVWAGVASKATKQITPNMDAALWVYSSDDNGGVSFYKQPVAAPIKCQLNDWTIQIDMWLLEKLAILRQKRLPNETGGVLLGSFDTYRRICSIIDVISSPPDSKEWPTSYIRGCEGLAEKVKAVHTQTLGQINYVGEWHSHPRGASTNPSEDDRKAYGWLVGHMSVESLPAIMMIIGDKKQFCLVSTEPTFN
jgi:integrative and conjugative element protein (TIGR02256 family)